MVILSGFFATALLEFFPTTARTWIISTDVCIREFSFGCTFLGRLLFCRGSSFHSTFSSGFREQLCEGSSVLFRPCTYLNAVVDMTAVFKEVEKIA